jgi:hypothetical protein
MTTVAPTPSTSSGPTAKPIVKPNVPIVSSFPVPTTKDGYLLSTQHEQLNQMQNPAQQKNDNNGQSLLQQVLPTQVPLITDTVKVKITLPPAPSSIPLPKILDTKLEIQVKLPAL